MTDKEIKSCYEMVQEFAAIFHGNSTRELKYKLLDEEAKEYETAVRENDIIEIADAIADMLYVVLGTMIFYKIKLEDVPVFMELSHDIGYEISPIKKIQKCNTMMRSELPHSKYAPNFTAIFCQLWFISETHGVHKCLYDLFKEVHRSNMTKLPLDGKPTYNDFNKVTKPTTFEEPDLKTILKKHGVI